MSPTARDPSFWSVELQADSGAIIRAGRLMRLAAAYPPERGLLQKPHQPHRCSCTHMRIAGFNSSGEARIVDDDGRLVAYGELRLADAYSVERGDRFALEVVVTWTPQLPDPDEMDFDGLDWGELLR